MYFANHRRYFSQLVWRPSGDQVATKSWCVTSSLNPYDQNLFYSPIKACSSKFRAQSAQFRSVAQSFHKNNCRYLLICIRLAMYGDKNGGVKKGKSKTKKDKEQMNVLLM